MQRLRPGSWKLVNSGGASVEFQIDWETFDCNANSEVDFMVEKMGYYDETQLTAYRNPVNVTTNVSNVGSKPDYPDGKPVS